MYINHDDLKAKILEGAKKKNVILDLENPKTIQDKINWLKLYDVTPLKSKCADKILVHDYCKEKLGKDICVPILKIYDSPDDININNLPDKFVLKCNHGYNMNIICTDKSKFNIETSISKLNKWLNTDFGNISGQLHYSGISPKCYAEKYLSDKNQIASLFDYKFWCFNGEPKMWTINDGRGHGDIMYFDMNQNKIDLYGLNSNIAYATPSNFKTMKSFATILSQDFKFARVDFYEVNGKIYLGEMTFTPGNGYFKYKDEKTNLMVGNMLDIK